MKQTVARMGWCLTGHHWNCRHIVKQSETEELICSCTCHSKENE